MSKLTPQVQSILDDLEHLDFANPVLDKRIVEKCLAEHFRLLGLPMLPVHWVLSLKEYTSYTSKTKIKENRAWRVALDAVQRTAILEVNNGELFKRARIVWSTLWSNSGIWARIHTLYSCGTVVTAFESALYLNSSNPDTIAYGNILLPLVKAVKSGLGVYYVTKDEIICCPIPKLIIKNGQFHNETGPAVLWSNGEAHYFYKGVKVTKEIVEKRFSWGDIEIEKNQEIRRVMLDIYGLERYVKESRMVSVHTDDFGMLYTKTREDGTTFATVKVVNSTPEPDGSFKDYFIRVNPTLYDGDAGKIAHAAVASTWRTKDGKLAFKRWQEYCPAYET